MHSHADHPEGGHPHLWMMPKLMATALRHLWSSGVNAAAVDLLDPQPGEYLVDLGSGFGPATVLIARRLGPGGLVIAVDPSRSMRLILRARRQWQPNKRAIDTRSGTGEALPLAAESFDAAIALNAMHHLKDLRMTATELHRVLKPAGRLVLADEDFGDPDHSFHQAAGEHHHGPELVDSGKMAGVLRSAGFAAVVAEHRSLGGEPAYVLTAVKAAA